MREYVRKADLILIGVLIIISLGCLLLMQGGSGEIVTVKQGDRILYEGDLHRNTVIDAVGDYHNVIRVEQGEVYMEASDCPGKDCIHRGKISRSGQRIACAPNGVIISVSDSAESEVDMIAG